jgi:hypothetical protein
MAELVLAVTDFVASVGFLSCRAKSRHLLLLFCSHGTEDNQRFLDSARNDKLLERFAVNLINANQAANKIPIFLI